LGVKIVKFFVADPGWKKFEFENRDKHSGSATQKLGTDITRPVCQKVTVLVISVKCPIKRGESSFKCDQIIMYSASNLHLVDNFDYCTI
jgi:hypothetical protein